MSLPAWIVVPLALGLYWPVTLLAVLGLAVFAAAARGRGRVIAGVLAVLLALPGLGGALYALDLFLEDRRETAELARRETVLATAAVIEGLPLPAGTTVTWEDASHRTLVAARFPRPTELLGVPAHLVRRGHESWEVESAAPREVGGWSCGAGHVVFGMEGRLRFCALAADTAWRGWPLPAGTHLSPRGNVSDEDGPDDGSLGLFFSGSPPPAAPEIGRPLPIGVRLHPDGSLASAHFRREEPLTVAGVPLFGDVRWLYDPATFGRGRARPPVAVEGIREGPFDREAGVRRLLPVRVRLPDGAVEDLPHGRGAL